MWAKRDVCGSTAEPRLEFLEHHIESYCVGGSRPLCLSTSVHLFKTLVWPVVEYGDSIWGAMCNQAALTMLEQVQERFCRRIMRLPSSVGGEYVRRELGLGSM